MHYFNSDSTLHWHGPLSAASPGRLVLVQRKMFGTFSHLSAFPDSIS